MGAEIERLNAEAFHRENTARLNAEDERDRLREALANNTAKEAKLRTALQDILDYAEAIAGEPNANQTWLARDILEPINDMAKMALGGGE